MSCGDCVTSVKSEFSLLLYCGCCQLAVAGVDVQAEFISAYGALIRSVWSGRFSAVRVNGWDMLKGDIDRENSCQSLVSNLLDTLHRALHAARPNSNGYPGPRTSTPSSQPCQLWLRDFQGFVAHLFCSVTQTTYTCDKCAHEEAAYAGALTLPFPVVTRRIVEVRTW
jgi:hypothetical protein